MIAVNSFASQKTRQLQNKIKIREEIGKVPQIPHSLQYFIGVVIYFCKCLNNFDVMLKFKQILQYCIHKCSFGKIKLYPPTKFPEAPKLF